MEKYWLLLEAYAFVWIENEEVLFYNSLSGGSFKCKITDALKPIIKELLNENNLYCVEITQRSLSHVDIYSLVKKLRNLFIGDLYSQSEFSGKPLVVVPRLSINEDLKNEVEDLNNVELFGQKILNNLYQITFYLTGKCQLNCKYCQKVHKQFVWCKKCNSSIDYNKIQNLLLQLKHSNLSQLNLVGGNPFNYYAFAELLKSVKQYSFKKNIYVHYKSIVCVKEISKCEFDKSFTIKVLVDCPIDKNILMRWMNLNYENVEFVVMITSLKDFEDVNAVSELNDCRVFYMPFYIESNLPFFEQNVYYNENDLQHIVWTKKDIFAHQVLNTNFFGSLMVDSDGKIYSNFNYFPIGEIDEDMAIIVSREMKEGEVWHKTRNNIPVCKDCIYKYLCPSPSNYEIIIGKNNLCHINNVIDKL